MFLWVSFLFCIRFLLSLQEFLNKDSKNLNGYEKDFMAIGFRRNADCRLL